MRYDTEDLLVKYRESRGKSGSVEALKEELLVVVELLVIVDLGFSSDVLEEHVVGEYEPCLEGRTSVKVR